MIVYLLTGAALVVYLVLVWFIGTWLQLRGSDLWILRGALWLIGLVAAGIFLWFHHKKKSAQADPARAPEGQPGSSDIDLLVHEANRRLKSSTLGRGATLGNLPLLFLLGESGSTKTSMVLHSALEPELLAGQVFQDSNVLPTRVANIWYTREALFVDPAGDLAGQQERWKRLVRLVQPSRMSSAIGSRRQAPRAAIVCFDCASFLQPGASEATLSAARKLAARLHEISQTLSISFPVYVLFTKLDRVSFFTEFVRGLSNDEASEVLGATLPVRSLATGAYAEEETKRLTKVFDELFFSLAEKRVDLLARENEVEKLAGIYEFPRELRKLRSLLVQFLVDLARPSQLTVNPFLRGFYFSGVRPVIVEDAVQAAPQVQVVESGFDAGATRIFGGGAVQPQRSPVPARVAGSRKVPQWVFLSRLFNEVIVKDRVALAASGFSSRVSLLRRLALGFVTAVGVVCAIAFVISFVGNRSLESKVRTTVEQLKTAQHPAANQLPTLADLQNLDLLRQELLVLSTYQRDGAPWHLRWGLYFGDRIYPDARRVYFERFRQLLFSDTQARLLNALRAVPAKPGANDTSDKTYDELKAYLMTTAFHEKSTQAYLSPVLTSRWNAGRNVDTAYLNLVRLQFDFYSSELASANPYSSDNDSPAVARARAYLGQFGGIDRYYRPIVDEASRKFPSVSFNEQFTNSAGVFVSDHRVPGAFTKSAFSFVQDAIRNPSRYISAEDWVLGKATATTLDQATLQQKLTERYYRDYINEWRDVLTTSHVVKFGLPEAYDRLVDKLASPISPLLELMWLVSYNIDVGVPEITNVFAPVAAIEKPVPREQLNQGFVNPDNTPYVTALAKVGVDVDTYQRTPGDLTLSTQALHSAGSADLAARAVTSAHVDTANHTEESVRKLLEEPIVYVEDGLTKTPIDALNAAGQGFCQKFDAVRKFYPFTPTSPNDLPIDQLNAIFAPGTGALWAFYNDAKLGTHLTRDGSRYVANPSAPASVKITPEFLVFFNRMAGFSDAFYPQGSTTPRFAYTLKELQSEGLALKVGADILSAPGQQKTFNWTGTGQEVQITTIGAEPLESYPGSWSVFRFVGDSHPDVSGSSTDLEWMLQVNRRNVVVEGKNKSFKYELQVSGANPFRASELSSLRCVATVAKPAQ